MIAFYVVAALLVVAVLLSLLRPLLRAGAGAHRELVPGLRATTR